jgi:thioredoxin 1
MKIRSPVPFAVLALAALACSASADAPAAAAPAAPSRTAAAAPQRLVFFMNPNGVPCQLQDRVLRELAPELSGRADLVYYRTTEQADLAQFSAYGIRALPTLVVTDRSGREIRRATPGIHSAEEIRQLVAP